MSQNQGQIKNSNVSNNVSPQMRKGKQDTPYKSKALKENISSKNTSKSETQDAPFLHLSHKEFHNFDTLKDAPDLVCLSHLRWNFVFQRPQHLLIRFAQGQRVFFIEEPIFSPAHPASPQAA